MFFAVENQLQTQSFFQSSFSIKEFKKNIRAYISLCRGLKYLLNVRYILDPNVTVKTYINLFYIYRYSICHISLKSLLRPLQYTPGYLLFILRFPLKSKICLSLENYFGINNQKIVNLQRLT